MIIGLSIAQFTVLHVAITLIAMVTGLVVMFAMLSSNSSPGWTALFLLTMILTSVTGFMFPSSGFTPAQGIGYLSLAILVFTVLAIYVFRLAGPWRWIYVLGAVLTLYLNMIVLVIQAFQKVPFLSALAPTQSAPPFLIAQGVLLLFFVVFGFLSLRKFHPELHLSA